MKCYRDGSSEPFKRSYFHCLFALRDAGRAIAEATERKAQVTVLMDTVETLHAGGDSERDQRIVSLTAQLAASRTGEAVLEARAGELLAEAEARQVSVFVH